MHRDDRETLGHAVQQYIRAAIEDVLQCGDKDGASYYTINFFNFTHEPRNLEYGIVESFVIPWNGFNYTPLSIAQRKACQYAADCKQMQAWIEKFGDNPIGTKKTYSELREAFNGKSIRCAKDAGLIVQTPARRGAPYELKFLEFKEKGTMYDFTPSIPQERYEFDVEGDPNELDSITF